MGACCVSPPRKPASIFIFFNELTIQLFAPGQHETANRTHRLWSYLKDARLNNARYVRGRCFLQHDKPRLRNTRGTDKILYSDDSFKGSGRDGFPHAGYSLQKKSVYIAIRGRKDWKVRTYMAYGDTRCALSLYVPFRQVEYVGKSWFWGYCGIMRLRTVPVYSSGLTGAVAYFGHPP